MQDCQKGSYITFIMNQIFGILLRESPKVIQTAFEQGYEPIPFLVEDRHIKKHRQKMLYCNIRIFPVYTASFDALKQLTGFGLTRGMLCAMRRKPLPALETICDHANESLFWKML